MDSVVDTSFLAHNQDPDLWGQSMLASLPSTLNAHASIDLGRAGLEMRSTPDVIGQRTLELRLHD